MGGLYIAKGLFGYLFMQKSEATYSDTLFCIAAVDAVLYGGRRTQTEAEVREIASVFDRLYRIGISVMKRPCERQTLKLLLPPIPHYRILPVQERVERDVETLKGIFLPGGKCGGRKIDTNGLLVETRRGWRVTKEVQRIVLEYHRHDYAWVNATHVERAMSDNHVQ